MVYCFCDFWNHLDGEIYSVCGRGDSEEEAYENMTSQNNCGKYLEETLQFEDDSKHTKVKY